MASTYRSPRRAVAWGGALAASALLLTACGASTPEEGADGEPATVTMWARASTASQSQLLVDAFNAEHETQIDLTVVPTDNYLQKVGVAAGADELPCVLASDVVYMPNFVRQNLFLDVTDRVEALEFADALVPGHMDLGTEDGVIYSVPHTIGMSAIFQNDVLLERAGIDPSAELGSLRELADNAAAVAALGPEFSGLYYTGNNAGSISFTHFPAIWASGGEALSEDGTESLLSSDESVEVFEIFNEMFVSGATPDSVRNESGATRNDVFATGNVGYVLASNSVLEAVAENEALTIGVQGIPGVDGGVSTYVGGDVVGISSSCDTPDAAWEFLEWTLGEEAQVDVFAQNNILSVRTDLADNEFSAEDPRVVRLGELLADGRTPKALNYGQTFNDPNGPALTAFREALFGSDARAALEASDDAINSSLAN
ncbi:ABC transporter substrate-binding protein [Agromyces atrinae]|uniref:Multiple sugar transport system substrate-binding protein n=1 Tax=Agromyces atrinae TaxID=592376 RepID=A0A4Q2MCR6_9MICO|nr:sugar ABC transporter substrate-binding protein [Agromyces atrinae]NYD67289.1 multiple sugar transport system substrate-binding protein [Agromyces atrinae]RXZ86880.1 sugar ABC transporter substrate-binding protein [Agromyces atrinae]